MNILFRLSARHLRLNRRRTLITLVGIALSVGMVTAISGFIVSFQDLLYRDAVARDGLWHVRYSGLSAETAEQVAADPVFSSGSVTPDEEGLTVTLLFSKLDKRAFDRSEEVCLRYGVGMEQVRYNNNLLIAKGIIPAGYYESLYAFAAILLTLVAIASVMVISNAFSISAGERSRQFGLLKSVGATSRQIRGIVLWEGVSLGARAIPLGILMGVLVQWAALTVANYILGSMEAVNLLAEFRVTLAPWTILLTIAVTCVTIFLAAWFPARRASRQSAIDAIRQTSEVRIRPRDVRVSPLVGGLFGFEGILAAKTMKRNRRRYRTTVVSLAVSIVLFIGVTSFGQMLFKASSMIYDDYGSNVLVRIHGEDTDRQNRLAAEIGEWEGVQAFPQRELQGTAVIPPEWMTETGNKMLEPGEKNVFLYSLSEEAFASLCRSLRLNPEELSDPDHPGAILVNATGTYIRQGRRYNFTPYRSLTGDTLDIALESGSRSLTIRGETDAIPTEFDLFFSANGITLILPESVRASWLPESASDYLSVVVMASHADAFETRAEEFLAGELAEAEFDLINYEAMVANSRNIWLLIMIFVYGFIVMLSLISVTNVVTTISTGIALRKRELAMLRSMGMTQDDIYKSLRYESLIYGVKSLAFGIPLGIAASLGMYFAIGASMSFEYMLPVGSVAISVLTILVLTFATMRFAGRRHRKESIVGAMQYEMM